jgi:hypothetical protein
MTARRIVPFAIILWVITSIVAYRAWIAGADHRDFYPRWGGARLALFERLNPYAAGTTARLQRNLYGEVLSQGVDQQGFAYPAHLIPLLLPLWLVNDVEIATAIWEGFSFVAIIMALWALGSVTSRPKPWVPAWLAAWAYSMVVIFQGQMTVLPLLGISIGIWAYFREKDFLAGAALVLSTVKPEIALLPIVAFAFVALRERRHQVITGFMTVGVLLTIASILISGWWLPDWISQLGDYAEYAQVSWAPGTAWEVHALLAIGLFSLLGFALYRAQWTTELILAVSIPVGLLILPQTLIWSMAILLIPLLLAWRGRARWAVAGLWVLGWVALIYASTGELWKVQMLIFPLLTALLIARRQGK